MTFYDELWQLMTFYDVLCQRDKATFVANCRDIFLPSPSRRPLLAFADLGSAIWRFRQHTIAERVKVRQNNIGFGKKYAHQILGV